MTWPTNIFVSEHSTIKILSSWIGRLLREDNSFFIFGLGKQERRYASYLCTDVKLPRYGQPAYQARPRPCLQEMLHSISPWSCVIYSARGLSLRQIEIINATTRGSTSVSILHCVRWNHIVHDIIPNMPYHTFKTQMF